MPKPKKIFIVETKNSNISMFSNINSIAAKAVQDLMILKCLQQNNQ